MAQINDDSTVERFEGVKTRLLDDRERPFPTVERGTPLVIEPGGARDVGALSRFMAENSEQVKQAVYAHGAIVFRGFKLANEAEFEAAMTSLRGLRPMSSYFMAEPGRDKVGGTENVFNTNSYKRTGGSLTLSGFHSENFYSTDVPSFQIFWCKTKPWLGGETGLIHMTHAYAELDAELQAKIESEPVGSVQLLVSQVAQSYGLPEDRIERFFTDLGLLATRGDGAKVVNVHKPPVYLHPHRGTRSLQINLAGEVRATTPLLERMFEPCYRSPKWALHRLTWPRPLLVEAWGRVERLPAALRYPKLVGREEWAIVKGMVKKVRAQAKRRAAGIPAAPKAPRAGGGAMAGPPKGVSPAQQGSTPYGMKPISWRLEPKDIQALAKAVRKHCTVFTWQTGDILFFDNLQVLHGGMPGLGPRVIRVMMCNPIPLKYPFTSGVVEVKADEDFRSVDERLRALASEVGARPQPG